MPGLDGLAAAAALAQAAPEVRVIILTTFGRPGYLRRAMESGALGFVVKDAPAEQLADAVRRVAAGGRVVDPALAAATLAGGASPLTGRERDVLVAARGGATVADIAKTLFLSEGTVRNYLSAAIAKTGVRNRIEAVRVAAGGRVVDPALAAATLAGGASPLTGRERDVLVAAREGATVADIAKALFLSEGTVRNYLSAAIAKTGVRNRIEAVRVADDRGWL
jgi:two-component system response regulator DesR